MQWTIPTSCSRKNTGAEDSLLRARDDDLVVPTHVKKLSGERLAQDRESAGSNPAFTAILEELGREQPAHSRLGRMCEPASSANGTDGKRAGDGT